MEVNCEGCAGCCIDWRPISPLPSEHERRGPYEPLDDAYNLVPLTRDDVRAFVENGLGDALTPRLWRAEDGVEIDGVEVAAIGGDPAFFVGLRSAPKPVGPFDESPTWLPTCAFLDPTTLQCRIHDAEVYPRECAEYPGHNLALDAETECERVERAFGGDRLLDDEPEDSSGLLLGPGALGQKVFVHPRPEGLGGGVERARAGDLTDADRASFVAWAFASSPGTTAHNEDAYEDAYERVLATDSWVGAAIADWEARDGDSDPDPGLAERIEDARGAPDTPGWDGG